MKKNIIIAILISFYLFIITPAFAVYSLPSTVNKDGRIVVQQILNKVLTPSPNLILDGILGPTANISIKQFQNLNSLTPDGVVGRGTIRALIYASNKIVSTGINITYTEPPKTTYTPPITPISTNTTISIITKEGRITIQNILNKTLIPSPNLTLDGSLGRASKLAIKQFQSLNNLTPDGVVGYNTRIVLSKKQTTTPGLITITTCATGQLFNTLTGKPCTGTPTTVVVNNPATTSITPPTYSGGGSSGGRSNGGGTTPPSPDATIPIISSFIIPSTSTSLTVPITTFTASDNVGVTGYLLKETSTPPISSDPLWQGTKPTTYVFSSTGAKTLYSFVKDSAGNVSVVSSSTTTINLVVVTVPSVPTSVSASSSNASATVIFLAPASNGGSPITGYTVISIPAGGTDTNAGSISLSHSIIGLTNGTSYTFTVKATNLIGQSVASVASSAVTPNAPVDITLPTISSFIIPSTSTSLTVPIATFNSSDNIGVTGYLLKEMPTPPLSNDVGWLGIKPTIYVFSSPGSKTLYAFVKDSAGNVSTGASGAINITLTASIYYVSSTDGNDINCTGRDNTPYISGTNQACPFKTLTKVNTLTLSPGNSILFKKGDTFYGTITVSQSGSAGNPITFSSYGNGEKPVVTGFTTVSGWTNENGGIYSFPLSSEEQTNTVVIDGELKGMGRWPNSDFLTIDAVPSDKVITDNDLSSSPNWSGAEVVIRRNDWELNRYLITNHNNHTLTYESIDGSATLAKSNYGYFIQNDLRTLDSFGEWYHDINSGKFYMYFGGVAPSSRVVKVATVKKLFYAHTNDYIIVDGLYFTGSIDMGIQYYWGSEYGVVKNNGVSFSGSDCIRYSGSYGIITNNDVNNCVSSGIGAYYNGTNNIITFNTISNVDLVEGLYRSIIGVWAPRAAIAVEYNDALVQYNSIKNVGYIGIYFTRINNVTIDHNVINNPCQLLDDCGGIYTDGNHESALISNNLIFNSKGNTKGTNHEDTLSEGIYLDEHTSGVSVLNNTVSGSTNSGIKFHMSANDVVKDNIFYNNKVGINFENWQGVNYISGNVLEGNMFIAKDPSQLALRFRTTVNEIPLFGTANNNYYARPIDDSNVFYVGQPSIGIIYQTLSQWQTFSGQDTNSHKSPVGITDVNDILFEYNTSLAPKTISLTGNYVDITGAVKSGTITIPPYCSIVLIKQ